MRWLVLILVVASGGGSAMSADSIDAAEGLFPAAVESREAKSAPPPIRTPAELKAVMTDLQFDSTRMASLERLINLASPMLNSGPRWPFRTTGDPAQDALIKTAAEAVEHCNDLETVRQALCSSSDTLQYWALGKVPDDPNAKNADRWPLLAPYYRALAVRAAPHIRGEAQDRLSNHEGQGEFLAHCRENETSASNILMLVPHRTEAQLERQMNPHLLRLLNHPNEDVRHDALLFIGFISFRAPIYHMDVSDDVFARILELSRSDSAEMRGAAVYALTDVRGHNPQAIRERMFEMADDESDDVRWRIPAALADQLDRADVQAVLARLLEDESGIVRYFTIKQLGPARHIRELRELAAGADERSARFAAKKLKQLESNDR